VKLTPQQQKVVDICADRIRADRSKTGLIIWQVCKDYGESTKLIAAALQKRGTKVKAMSKGKEFVEIDVEVITSTPKAILVDCGGDEEKWIPKSLCGVYPGDGETGTAEVQRWYCEQEEII